MPNIKFQNGENNFVKRMVSIVNFEAESKEEFNYNP